MIAVLRYNDFELVRAGLAELGITVHQTEEGGSLRIEDNIGRVNTPPIRMSSGDDIFAIKLSDDEAELLPMYLSPPNFVCDWRSDELDEDTGEPYPYPTVEVDCEPYEQATEWSEDGLPTAYETITTRTQGVTRIV